MEGRIFKIKKTTILSVSFHMTFLLFALFTLLSIFLFKNNYLWFFFFCLFIGGHLLIKSSLFRLDSSCYFGSVLFWVGVMGLLVNSLGLYFFQSVYYILAFSFASFTTFCFFRQRFHLLLSLILFIIDIAWFCYKVKLIALWVFIMVLVTCVLSFVIRYLISNVFKRS